MTELSEDIRARAKDIGFSLIGFANAEPLINEGLKLDDWLDRKYNGTMRWLEKKKDERKNPLKIMPYAKSVIVCAINYYQPEISTSNSKGKISRYAWGADYHTVLKSKLKELSEFISSKRPGALNYIEVDTGPIMEKVWAHRAGIGWQGKHSIIINQKYGSWIFLGIILTDIELRYDHSTQDMCGSCTLCINVCPTNAIATPYLLDASKCISYLTIEHRGEVSKDLSDKYDNWIYGCDICQNICPWNQKNTNITDEPEFVPREYSIGIEHEKILSMNETEFNKLFENSPIKRRKLEGMQENVRNILQNKKE
ncbi:MAG: tRNA epoxyqueuosine(34) reductase QueG [Ignavibacteriales bacterium]|nr:tRNA epoxyqueuosine(34) reductase QueG [Ignavibacteriales bacterium]